MQKGGRNLKCVVMIVDLSAKPTSHVKLAIRFNLTALLPTQRPF